MGHFTMKKSSKRSLTGAALSCGRSNLRRVRSIAAHTRAFADMRAALVALL